MGAKYLPTIKDQKAVARYQQKKNPLPKSQKTAANLPAKARQKK